MQPCLARVTATRTVEVVTTPSVDALLVDTWTDMDTDEFMECLSDESNKIGFPGTPLTVRLPDGTVHEVGAVKAVYDRNVDG